MIKQIITTAVLVGAMGSSAFAWTNPNTNGLTLEIVENSNGTATFECKMDAIGNGDNWSFNADPGKDWWWSKVEAVDDQHVRSSFFWTNYINEKIKTGASLEDAEYWAMLYCYAEAKNKQDVEYPEGSLNDISGSDATLRANHFGGSNFGNWSIDNWGNWFITPSAIDSFSIPDIKYKKVVVDTDPSGDAILECSKPSGWTTSNDPTYDYWEDVVNAHDGNDQAAQDFNDYASHLEQDDFTATKWHATRLCYMWAIHGDGEKLVVSNVDANYASGASTYVIPNGVSTLVTGFSYGGFTVEVKDTVEEFIQQGESSEMVALFNALYGMSENVQIRNGEQGAPIFVFAYDHSAGTSTHLGNTTPGNATLGVQITSF